MERHGCYTRPVSLHNFPSCFLTHFCRRNVPGVALYFTSLTHLRSVMANSPSFSVQEITTKDGVKTVLPKLTSQGNLIAGAAARVGVGFLLNPFSVLKARFEAC
jgi:solute carrier family 25 protein 38